MTITVTPIQNNQTFGAWLSTTNRLANIISQNTVTADSSTGGSLTTGNAYVNGFFGASYVYADQGLIGGNVSSNGTLNLIANAAFRYSTSNLMTVTANGTNSNVSLRADNTAIVGNTLFINATINAVSSANLAGAVAIANTLSVSNAATFSDVINVEDIIPLVNATFDLGSVTNVFDNAFIRTVQFSTGSANGTNYTGTAANATNLNSQPGSFYTNATNITTGTLATARLPATVNVTTLNTQTVNTVTLIANNSAGTLGQTLLSNGTGIYWGTAATVTSVGSGNGLTGGTITTTGTLSVVQGTGTVVNATGVHVNATYIGTLTANNSVNLGGQPASFYTNATNLTTGTLNTARLPSTVNVATINVNAATVSNTLTINGNATFNQTALTQSLIPTANMLYSLGNSSNRFEIAYIGTVQLSDGNSISSGIFSGTANNANNLNGQSASFYTNATNLATGTVPNARLPSASVSTPGIVQLVDSFTNNSITIAATANSVKSVYDFASQIAATGTPPSGTNTQVQFNNSNTFGGSAGFTFNSTTATVTVSNTIIANVAFNAGANVVVNTTAVGVGNTSVNTVISAGALTINGVNVNTAITGNAATAYTNAIAIAANASNLTSGTVAAARLSGSYTITASNATNLNNQPDTFYTNASNLSTGTVPTGRLTGTYAITANNATNLNSQPGSFYTNATNLSTGTVPTDRLSGTYAITANNATNLNGQAASFYTNASNITAGTLDTARLPATVNVATALNVGTTVVVNTTAFGVGNSSVNTAISAGTLTINGVNVNTAITGNAATAYTNAIAIAANATNLTSGTVAAARLSGSYTITASNATNLNNQPDTFYTNASNLSTGTVPTGRLTGTYAITANNATNLNGQPDTFYTNATNLSTGTVAAARLSGTYAITANNATNLNGQAASFYTNATNISTGTLDTARLPATVNVATAVNVGASVGLTTDTLRIGNSSVNTAISAGTLTINGANSLTVGTAAYVVANGNVGIGTSLPGTKLTVDGTVTAVTVSSNSVVVGSGINITANTVTYSGGNESLFQSGSTGTVPGTGALSIAAGGAARFRVSSTQAKFLVPIEQSDGSGAAPKPTTSSAVGQVVALNSETSNTVTLPSGGTWLYYVFGFDSQGRNVGQSVTDIASGGTAVGPANAPSAVLVRCFAWRQT